MTSVAELYDGFAERVLDRLRDPLLLALRLFIGWQFYLTGVGKLQNIDRVVEFFASLGIPAAAASAWLVSILETVGGILLFLGLGARLVAVPLTFSMVVAYLTADRESLTSADAFLSAAPFPYLVTSAVIMAFGPGRVSLDALIRRWTERRSRVSRHPSPAAPILVVGMAIALAGPACHAAPERAGGTARAYFAMGCFWCAEDAFERVDGVGGVVSGYMGGSAANPTYDEVSNGSTGHLEAVEVSYDPSRVAYDRLLDVFWHNVDPLDAQGQFCDRGEQYLSAIFVSEGAQRRAAEGSREAVGRRFGRVATRVLPVSRFWPAEEYHQDYYRKNPVRYRFYKFSCGRQARLEEVWGEAKSSSPRR